MNSDLTAYITLICTSCVFSLYLCIYVFAKRHHYKNIAPLFILHTLFTSIYCLGAAFGLMSTTLAEIKFWTVIQYLGMPFSATMGLIFIMRYLGMNLSSKKLMALLAVPFTSLILVASNDFHQLYYRAYEIHPELGAPFVYQEIGIWYVVQGIYTFASLFVAFIFVFSRWRETDKDYRPQLLSLLWGQLVPMITAFVYLLGLTPQGIDPVPMVLWLTSLFYFWAIRSSRMFSIMPIAKDAIFNSINDGVIVLDEAGRLIEFNQAGKSMFPQLYRNMFGWEFSKVWTSISASAFPLQLKNAPFHQEVSPGNGRGEQENTYQVHVTRLQDGQRHNGFLMIFNDITEVKKLQGQLEKLAYYDELTGIFNRRAFFQQCQQNFEDAKRESVPYTVLLMDIDFFKRVNDTYGHFTGDQLLVHVVKACQAQLDDEAIFARYGGEEFVIAMKGSTGSEGKNTADLIRSYLRLHPVVIEGTSLSVTVSFGIAETTEGKNETLHDLLNRADKALYSAKDEGRDRACVYREKARSV
ncbi:diguanylate cyclase [Bacillus salacetis]|uniref:Diguanylate cyclase n=1 Tax=Bacillus salacetis TaxID=2315464 RepID=A0A3A1QU07_9BACI|nr:histidine kinase N-terminal 7TM domain-containing protein [Bacillus salacetis]RIW28812.1 diguanylate cyclase [Bacillus salacetis]